VATSNPIAPTTTPAEPARYGEVYDRGYKHYDGERLGRKHAFGALIRYSIQRALGIKKRWTAKIVPIIIYIVAVGTVAILIGIESFLPNSETMSYSDFFIFIFLLEGLFVATMAPEMLCPDRRENVLTLYFSRAITRLDYVLAKLAATATLTLTVSLAPAALLWIFRQLLADDPASALTGNADELGKIAIAGALIALYLGGVGLAISSFTSRKAIAIPVIFVGYLVTEGLVNGFAYALRDQGWNHYLQFLSPATLVNNLVFTFFPTEDSASLDIPFEWWAYVAAMVATIVAAVAVMVWRYVPED
jgi:ABC-2 type transport system permease protein